MIRRRWEREVKIRELEALPHVSCLALLCSERINATLHFFFIVVKYNMEFTIFRYMVQQS